MGWRGLAFGLSALLVCGLVSQGIFAQPPTKFIPAVGPARADGFEWLKPPPENEFPDDATHDLDESDFYEVVTSKNDTAIVRDLKDQSFVKITPQIATYFTGHYFECPQRKTPYLIRAVFGNGGTGRYVVKRMGRRLLVLHGSLGNYVANKSALVVNLDFVPEAIFTELHISR